MYTKEEQRVMRDQMKRFSIQSSLALVVISIVSLTLLNDKLDFGKYQGIKARNLTEIGPRIEYVFKHSTPGVVWLLFCVFYVVSKRVGTPAVIPTAGYEHLTEGAKNIFLNSLEQFVLSFTSQLILIQYIEPKVILNLIPVLNMLWIVGRILFWLGYPAKRTLGIMLNFIPLFTTIGFISYKYIKTFI